MLQGKDFLISWRIGCSKFTQDQASKFCQSNRMRPISLDSRAKEDHFLGKLSKIRKKHLNKWDQKRHIKLVRNRFELANKFKLQTIIVSKEKNLPIILTLSVTKPNRSFLAFKNYFFFIQVWLLRIDKGISGLEGRSIMETSGGLLAEDTMMSTGQTQEGKFYHFFITLFKLPL